MSFKPARAERPATYMTDSLHFDSSYWIPNPCQCNLDSRFLAFTGFRVLEQNSAFQKQKIPGFRNPAYLTWGEK